jgi:hypothetical protein
MANYISTERAGLIGRVNCLCCFVVSGSSPTLTTPRRSKLLVTNSVTLSTNSTAVIGRVTEIKNKMYY